MSCCDVNEVPICYTVAVGSTLTPLGILLRRPDGTAVDLTGKEVRVYAVDSEGDEVIAETITGIIIVDETNGQFQYDFQADDVDIAREYYMYFRVYGGGEHERFPPEARKLSISVQGDI